MSVIRPSSWAFLGVTAVMGIIIAHNILKHKKESWDCEHSETGEDLKIEILEREFNNQKMTWQTVEEIAQKKGLSHSNLTIEDDSLHSQISFRDNDNGIGCTCIITRDREGTVDYEFVPQ